MENNNICYLGFLGECGIFNVKNTGLNLQICLKGLCKSDIYLLKIVMAATKVRDNALLWTFS